MRTRDLVACAAIVSLLAAPAWAARFEADLDPVAFDISNRADVTGEGHVTAILDGNMLAVRGDFTGLASQATAAHLILGLAEGVPGDAIGDITIAKAQAGSLTATLSLTARQLAGLKAGGLYIQIDSQHAPDGTLWGWLEAAP